jgi:hypothetical protein
VVGHKPAARPAVCSGRLGAADRPTEENGARASWQRQSGSLRGDRRGRRRVWRPVGAHAAGQPAIETRAGGELIKDLGEAGDRFGNAMAITAADTDRFDDLIVNVPGERPQLGAVHVLRGSATGITAVGQAFWYRGAGGQIPGAQQAGFGQAVGGTSNGVIALGSPLDAFAGATESDPEIVNAGSAALIRVSDASPIGLKMVFEATEKSITAELDASFQRQLRADSRFGAAITSARPAFVPVRTVPARYPDGLMSGPGGPAPSLFASCSDEDVKPPRIESIYVIPACLLISNDRFVRYRLGSDIQVDVSDECDPEPRIRIVGVRVVDRGGTELTSESSDSAVFGDRGLCLRASRPAGGERDYVVIVEATDRSGNATQAETIVRLRRPPGNPNECPPIPPRFVDEGHPDCRF